MGYIPTEWQTGDIITAARLNKAEEGIAAASPVFISITYDESNTAYVLGASYNELKALMGKAVIGYEEYPEDPATYLCTYYPFSRLSVEDGTYSAEFFGSTITGGEPVPCIIAFKAVDPDANMVSVIPD